MKLLVVDQQGNALDWCLRCQDDGHEVRWFIKQTPKTEFIGRGLVKIVPDWRDHLRWADLVVLTDNVLYMREIDAARKEGVKVIGATQETAAWELDRNIGMAVFDKAGIATPPYKEFADYDKAIQYVKKEGRRFVSKPSGDADKALSYVAQSPADMVYMLERWKKAGKLKGAFILQEAIDGCEMAVGGWFGPGGFNSGWFENWEFKRLMPGDMGPNTGEQGTVGRYVKRSKLARKVLEPVAAALERDGYTGYVDVNCIIDEKGEPWPLEFTTRFGWPTFNMQEPLHDGDHAEWLLDLAEGRDARNVRMDEVSVGVIVAIPDYPYSHITRKEVRGVPIYGLTPALLAHVHPCEIMAGEAPTQVGDKIVSAPCWVTAGDYVLCATGVGSTVREARDKVYRVANRLKKGIPNSPMYRADIGNRLKKQIPLCQAHGYATGMEF